MFEYLDKTLIHVFDILLENRSDMITTHRCTLEEWPTPTGNHLYQTVALEHSSLQAVKEQGIFPPKVLSVSALDFSCFKRKQNHNKLGINFFLSLWIMSYIK